MTSELEITGTSKSRIDFPNPHGSEVRVFIGPPARERLLKPLPDLTMPNNFLKELDIVQQKMDILEWYRRNRHRLDSSGFENSTLAAYEIKKILTHNFFVLRNRIVRIRACFKTKKLLSQTTDRSTGIDIEVLGDRVDNLWYLYQELKRRLYSGRFEVICRNWGASQ